MGLVTSNQVLCKGASLTQAQFADTLTVSQGMVSRLEKGKHVPSKKLLKKFLSSPALPWQNYAMAPNTARMAGRMTMR